MTAQFTENLLYEGEAVSMCSNPLSDYFEMGGISPRFESTCTALWRGNVGSWEVIDKRLYLIGLQGTLEDGTDASLATIFPEFPSRVFAHWYSGTIRIPQGRQIEYVHMGYGSTYERDLFLDLERGVVMATRIQNNEVKESEDTTEGCGLGRLIGFLRRFREDRSKS